MNVTDLEATCLAESEDKLQELLNKRYAGEINTFWMAHKIGCHPLLSLLVKGELATLNYLPKEGDAEYWSTGNPLGLKAGEMISFGISKDADNIQVLPDAVVAFPIAVEAAKEFFATKQLPTCIEWTKL